MSRVAVTGATGYVGKFVVPELARQGWAVRALVRPVTVPRGFPPTVTWVKGDLTNPLTLSELLVDTDAVVHLAYRHIPGRYRGGEGDDLAVWLHTNLTGSLKLLLAARAAGVKQIVFLSSRAVFSRTEPGRVLDENHPTWPDTHYGAYKVAVEALLRSFATVEGIVCTSVRATGVYGKIWPVERSKWWSIIQAVLAGQPVTTSRAGTEVHGDDLARTISALLAGPEHIPEIVHLSDLVVSHRQIVSLAQQAAGLSGPLPPPPEHPPQNILACPRLAELGITLGGEPLLAATIKELVAAAQAR
jgi:nucleoside-diphosphate-sugar epimerase